MASSLLCHPCTVWAFLGLCFYYRWFIKDYAHNAEPLHCLSHKEIPFVWCDRADGGFRTLKGALTSPPEMAFPDLSITFILHTDASHHAIGSVLCQVIGGMEHVISYASHVLSALERKWSTFDRELYAVVWSMQHFRHYLACRPFMIVRDHKPLAGLEKLLLDHYPTGRRAR